MIYQCLYCPFSTERKYNLKVHEERKHRRNIEYKEEVNEELDEERSVSDLKDLKAHMDTTNSDNLQKIYSLLKDMMTESSKP